MNFDSARSYFVAAFEQEFGYTPDIAPAQPPGGVINNPHSYRTTTEWRFNDTSGKRLGYYKFDKNHQPIGTQFLSDEAMPRP